MFLKLIHPRPELAPFIDKFWIFESDSGVPAEDSRVIAPNGRAKIIYTYINGLSTTVNGLKTDYCENDVFLIGIWDQPVMLSSVSQKTGTIGIELSPSGLHRFVRFPLSDIANRIFSFAEIYGRSGMALTEHLANTGDAILKAEILQDFLVKLLFETARENSLIDYTVNLISSVEGLVEIRELEKKTGYSKRYLDLLFRDHLGISPKTFSSITRFQTFYWLWANSDTLAFYKDNLLSLYYDQSHFIKEFKRFTGYSPMQYSKERNEFGKIFYRKAHWDK